MARKPKSTDISQDLEKLARELCMYHGHNPDTLVFTVRPETIRTGADSAVIIPHEDLIIPAWQLFTGQAAAVAHMKRQGLLG